MVVVRKRIIGNQEYFYLEHTIRKNGKVSTKTLYLGKTLPKNIEEIKKEFLSQIYKEEWYPKLEKIKKNYAKEEKQIPKSAKIKQTKDFAIKFTYDTQKIEGSKLTLKETHNLLEHSLIPKNREIKDIKEAEAHEKLFYEILSYKKDLSLAVVLHWHRKLFENSDHEIAGKIRRHQVAISGSKFVPPLTVELETLLGDFFKWYALNKEKLNPVELAFLVHLKFVTIHPFSDGNGRISRLLMNFVLNKYNYPLFDIPYEDRNSYYTALERSQIKKVDRIFLQWSIKRYLKEFKNFLNV